MLMGKTSPRKKRKDDDPAERDRGITTSRQGVHREVSGDEVIRERKSLLAPEKKTKLAGARLKGERRKKVFFFFFFFCGGGGGRIATLDALYDPQWEDWGMRDGRAFEGIGSTPITWRRKARRRVHSQKEKRGDFDRAESWRGGQDESALLGDQGGKGLFPGREAVGRKER